MFSSWWERAQGGFQIGVGGGGLAWVGMGEDGATYLASCLLDPAAKAQQPKHTDFSAPHWEWDDAGVKGTAARMEQLCVHALLAQLYAPELVQKGEVPPAAGAKGFGGRSAAESVQLQTVGVAWEGLPAAPSTRRAARHARRHLEARPLVGAFTPGQSEGGAAGMGGASGVSDMKKGAPCRAPYCFAEAKG